MHPGHWLQRVCQSQMASPCGEFFPAAATCAMSQRTLCPAPWAGRCCGAGFGLLPDSGGFWLDHRAQAGRSRQTTDQKEVEATGRRGGWDAWLFSEDYSDSTTTTTTKAGFIASCIIGKANSDGQSYPLQFSCLSFAFRIDYPARKDFCCRDF